MNAQAGVSLIACGFLAVAEKRAGAAIHRAERPKLIFLGEPVVGVIGQKLRRIRAHQLIILLRNAEIVYE